jgi:hypothetical protein
VLVILEHVEVGGEKFTFFAVYQVVVVLHAGEFVPAVLVGDVLEGLELPGCHLFDSEQNVLGLDFRLNRNS